jgi:pyruvate/2-oxoglutarate dehydrogenase complex dihydrolipoamide dehydrogenase (E3) component
LDRIPFLTTENISGIDRNSIRLIVIAGGHIGYELGQTFARFGFQVTIIQQREHLVPEEKSDASTV